MCIRHACCCFRWSSYNSPLPSMKATTDFYDTEVGHTVCVKPVQRLLQEESATCIRLTSVMQTHDLHLEMSVQLTLQLSMLRSHDGCFFGSRCVQLLTYLRALICRLLLCLLLCVLQLKVTVLQVRLGGGCSTKAVICRLACWQGCMHV